MNKEELEKLTHGFILKNAYNAYWKRDLISAQKLFRKLLALGYFQLKDLKFITLSLLPLAILRRVLKDGDD